jgi:hypothetical protein
LRPLSGFRQRLPVQCQEVEIIRISDRPAQTFPSSDDSAFELISFVISQAQTGEHRCLLDSAIQRLPCCALDLISESVPFWLPCNVLTMASRSGRCVAHAVRMTK